MFNFCEFLTFTKLLKTNASYLSKINVNYYYMRKIILSVLGVLIIIAAIFGAKSIIANKKVVKKPTPKKVVQSVYAIPVKNTNIPVIITSTGILMAKKRVELYAEVQGIFKNSARDFKTGQSFRKGEVLVNINSSEYYASVQAAKSNLYNVITSIMPDLRLDYPNVFEKWQQYLSNFDMDKTTPKLPEITQDNEKYFITGKGIFSSYYNVKNLEQRLSKYTLYAPFSGVLTNASVTKGTLIRSSQKLGEFIQTGIYEMEVSVSTSYANMLKVGGKVLLTELKGDQEYTGKITRVNGSIDPTTQTILASIEVNSTTLKEGMYLEAKLNAKEAENAISIERNLLQENNKVYVIKNNVLDLASVTPIHFSEKNVIIQGLKEGALLLSKNIPDAYAGMTVKVIEDSSDNN